jgi:hypothetical protein
LTPNPSPADAPDANLKSSLQALLPEIERILGPGSAGLTLPEMITASGLPESEFHETYLSWVQVEADHFHLYKRIKHVVEESLRVLEFRDTCLSPPSDKSALEALGELMNESQSSCAAQFECSCDELDDLVRVARGAGAVGSRLTGAGWGGCTVSLVRTAEVDGFMQKVKEAYKPYQGLSEEKLKEAMFATKPGAGACGEFWIRLGDEALTLGSSFRALKERRKYYDYEVLNLIPLNMETCLLHTSGIHQIFSTHTLTPIDIYSHIYRPMFLIDDFFESEDTDDPSSASMVEIGPSNQCTPPYFIRGALEYMLRTSRHRAYLGEPVPS